MRWLCVRSSLRSVAAPPEAPLERRFQFPLNARDLSFERLQLVHGLPQPARQRAPRGRAERNAANQPRNEHHGARQAPAQRAVHLGLHSARNGLQFLPELLGFLVVLFDFREDLQQLFGLLGDVLVGHHQVRHHQDVAHRGRILRNRLGQRQNLADHQRRAGERLAHRGLSALDALGQLDFAFAREQRHRSHLAQVHAHRIVGLVAEVLDQVQVGGLFALFQLLVEFDLGLFQDLDARACRVR